MISRLTRTERRDEGIFTDSCSAHHLFLLGLVVTGLVDEST
jgi:hypothetical protein